MINQIKWLPFANMISQVECSESYAKFSNDSKFHTRKICGKYIKIKQRTLAVASSDVGNKYHLFPQDHIKKTL